MEIMCCKLFSQTLRESKESIEKGETLTDFISQTVYSYISASQKHKTTYTITDSIIIIRLPSRTWQQTKWRLMDKDTCKNVTKGAKNMRQ